MKYYLYSNITGCHPSWTVAVLAVSRSDANQRINGPMWRGGKFAGEVESGNVKADCGDVTEKAGAILHEQLEEEYLRAKAVQARLTRALGREPTLMETVNSL
jgi:hypothetical protein